SGADGRGLRLAKLVGPVESRSRVAGRALWRLLAVGLLREGRLDVLVVRRIVAREVRAPDSGEVCLSVGQVGADRQCGDLHLGALLVAALPRVDPQLAMNHDGGALAQGLVDVDRQGTEARDLVEAGTRLEPHPLVAVEVAVVDGKAEVGERIADLGRAHGGVGGQVAGHRHERISHLTPLLLGATVAWVVTTVPMRMSWRRCARRTVDGRWCSGRLWTERARAVPDHYKNAWEVYETSIRMRGRRTRPLRKLVSGPRPAAAGESACADPGRPRPVCSRARGRPRRPRWRAGPRWPGAAAGHLPGRSRGP